MWVKAKMKRKALAMTLITMLVLSGCGTPEEQDSVVMIEQEREEIQYELAAVTVGDVQQVVNIKCTYEQEEDEDVSFEISGKKISEVYVKEGDHVVKGQLLAELSGGNLDVQIEQLEYQIARNKVELEYSELNENYEISRRWLNFMYGYGGNSQKALEEGIASLQQSYRYSREDLMDAIALDEMQLAAYKEEIEKSRVYAGMTGTITWLQEGLEGSTSEKGKKIITIIDSSKCLFVTKAQENIPYFEEGKEIEIRISSGTGAGIYTVVPYRMSEWGEEQTFTMLGDDDGNIIEVGTMGTMMLVVDSRENVLNIPKKAVHVADGKSYVYVLGQNNMREIKWVETGLLGDQNVEIISGLTRGEKVVIR